MTSDQPPVASDHRPNILFIMSDDHASNAISAYGGILAGVAPTPNIDRIARSGLRLDNCFCTNSICTPSRATILTGQHSHINTVRTLSQSLPGQARLLSEILKEHGYQTAVFGKWHLHCRPRGFDQWAVLPGQGLYFDPVFLYPSADQVPRSAQPLNIKDLKDYEQPDAQGCTIVREAGYVTDLITDKTLDWLKNRDDNRPFFLCCHHKAPHDNFEYPQRLEDYLQDVEIPEPQTLFEDPEALKEISRRYGSSMSQRWELRNAVKSLRRGDFPQYGPVDFEGLDADAATRKAYQLYLKIYLRAVRGIDENVGRVLDYLDETGLGENTIVIYTSDQGMLLGEHDKIDKRWIFDESQRMPLLVQYPGHIPSGSASDALVDNTDVAPTLLDFAGIEVPDWMQGRSFRGALSEPGTGGKDVVYYRYWMHMMHHWVPAHYGIRTRDHKLIFFYGMKLDVHGCFESGPWSENSEPGLELYDLRSDPLENRNLIHDPASADVASRMKRLLLQTKAALGDGDERYPELLQLQRQYLGQYL